MSDFNWRTEDESPWEHDADGERPPTGRRRWLWLLVLVALGLAGVAVFTRVRSTVQRVTAAEELALTRSAELLLSAAETADIAVFTTLLSGRERNWTALQQQMVGDGGLFARPVLQLAPVEPLPTVSSVTLAPDLNSAVVEAQVTYAAGGVTTTLSVPLAFGKAADGRWLYAAPDDQFWGGLHRYVGSAAQIDYPERDTAAVLALAPLINRIVQQLCLSEPALACDAQVLPIRMTTVPEAIMAPPLVDDAGTLILPAPSLIGHAVDDAGAALLARAYSHAVTRALLDSALARRCCTRVLIAEAIIDAWLVAHALAAPTLTAADYARLLDERRLLSEADDLGWQRLASDDARRIPHDERVAAAAIAEFIQVSDPALTLVEQFTALTPARQSLVNWVRDLGNLHTPTGGLGSDWQSIDYFDFLNPLPGANAAYVRFLAGRAGIAEAQPDPLPGADLVTACNAIGADAFALRVYDWQRADWTTRKTGYAPAPALELVALAGPRDASALLLGLKNRNAGPPFPRLLTATGDYQIGSGDRLFGYIDLPARRPSHLLLFALSDRVDSVESSWLYEMDVTACSTADGRCPVSALNVLPFWSPDSQHVVMLEPSAWRLQTADGTPVAEQPLDPAAGVSVVWWLDAHRFSWYDSTRGIMIATVDNPTPTVAIGRGDLAAALGAPNDRPLIWLGNGTAVRDPERAVLLLGAYMPTSSRSGVTLLRADLDRAEVSVLAEAVDHNGINQSNDGRVLAFISPTDQRSGRAMLDLIDVDGNRRTHALFGGFDFDSITWSPDGNWLIVWEGGYGMLIAVEGAARHYILPPADVFCANAGWLRR